MRSALVLFAGALAFAGCSELLCGEGTIEIDGVCVSMSAPPECGPGTHLDAVSGRCVNDDFTGGVGVCGPGTSLEISDAGVPTCVSLGGGGGCDDPLPCPPPEGQQTVSLCGRIHDLETSAPLDDGVAENGEPWKTVEIRIFDPFAFIANPNTMPLMKGLPDSCGRYALLEVPRPVAGIVALAIDDLNNPNGQPAFGDDLVQTGIADTIAAGDVRVGQRAWILKRTTDAAWSQAAGFTDPQMSFGRQGVYIPIFLGPGAAPAPFPGNPTENVQVAIIDNGQRTVVAAKDFYFDDTDPLRRTAVSPTRAQTGRNGTALYINQPGIASFSGLGALPEGVCWRTDPAAAPVGAAFVQERGPGPQFCTQ